MNIVQITDIEVKQRDTNLLSLVESEVHNAKVKFTKASVIDTGVLKVCFAILKAFRKADNDVRASQGLDKISLPNSLRRLTNGEMKLEPETQAVIWNRCRSQFVNLFGNDLNGRPSHDEVKESFSFVIKTQIFENEARKAFETWAELSDADFSESVEAGVASV